MENTVYRLAFTTCEDIDTANQLAKRIVAEKLVCCVNIISNMQSVYEWQGKIVTSAECKLMMKTRVDKIAALQACINLHHPYDVPEFQVVAIVDGSAAYFNWMNEVLG
ncbi:Periplasmic divalent cation tolerance protein CutA [Pseudoalteromonas luteoviolacea B = ATCC 29581]|nr:Periplasmic divalent cation tolerance protein CutA [Pseudoalteromonas luteoviolacea B = ATCC 29581]